MDYPLSNRDIVRLMDGKTRIVMYPELNDIESLDELLEPHGNFILLYEYKKNYGHWTACFRLRDGTGGIEFFDSYSYKPDGEKEFVPKLFQKKNAMVANRLAELLYAKKKGGTPITYNQFALQGDRSPDGTEIATCGRHCVVRIWLDKYGAEDYDRIMKWISDMSGGKTPDEIVVALTR